MVVDGGTWDPAGSIGDGKIEFKTNGGQGEVVEVDRNTNIVKIANTGDSKNRWIGPNKADIDFYVAGPRIVDDPLLTTDVELQSSEFSTTPSDADGLKEIVWNLNGVDQPGTTLNPYKPSGLAINTTYTVKVKHVAQKLEPSDWSDSITFTTGASRSLKEHYVSKILGLEEALKEAEAKPKRTRKKKED